MWAVFHISLRVLLSKSLVEEVYVLLYCSSNNHDEKEPFCPKCKERRKIINTKITSSKKPSPKGAAVWCKEPVDGLITPEATPYCTFCLHTLSPIDGGNQSQNL
jgi:hypothetical protein